MTYREIIPVIRSLAEKYDIKRNPRRLRDFMEEAFSIAAQKYDLCRDFQRRAKVYGDVFEAVFKVIMEELYPDIILVHECEIARACLTGQGKADFVAVDKYGNIKAVIEAKGSASYIVCDGLKREFERPGLIRTDTTKKAVANAAQVKYGISPDMPYIIVTSHKPSPRSNSGCILKLLTGPGKLVDMVVDITDIDELERMANYIRRAKPHNIRCSSSKSGNTYNCYEQ